MIKYKILLDGKSRIITVSNAIINGEDLMKELQTDILFLQTEYVLKELYPKCPIAMLNDLRFFTKKLI